MIARTTGERTATTAGSICSAGRPRILALEQRVLLLPAVDLVAGGAFERVHFLDGQRPKGLHVHREAGIDQLSCVRGLDDDPVQLPLGSKEQTTLPCKESSVISRV